MSNNIYIILILSLCIYSCKIDHSNTTEPVGQFKLLWKTSIPSFLPQGIILDQQGRDYLYVVAKGGGVHRKVIKYILHILLL